MQMFNIIIARSHLSNRGRRSAGRRDGYLYVAVLFTALLLSVAVAMTMVNSTANLRSISAEIDHRRASQLATSELNRLAAWMQNDSSWRQTAHNQFSSWRSISNGEVRHRFTDEDTDLNDDEFDNVTVTVHAKAGLAEAAVSADLEMIIEAAPMLNYRITATDNIEMDKEETLVCDGPIQAFDEIKGHEDTYITSERIQFGDKIDLNLEIRGDILEADAELISTDPIQLYAAVGTEIPRQSIPEIDSDRVIENVLISSSVNPFGAVDSNGIYRIDVKDEKLIIKNSRLDCLLVIEDARQVEIHEGVVWTHPPGHPAILLSTKKVKFDNLNSTLSEATSAANFNPSHTPFRGTYSNSNTTDEFQTEFHGIVFSEKEIEVKGGDDIDRVQFSGALIGSKVKIQCFTGVNELPAVFTNPPLGMRVVSSVAFIPGSFRQIETPQ